MTEPRRRSPYVVVLVVVALIVPAMIAVDIALLFFAVPSSHAVCERMVAVLSSASASSAAIDDCTGELDRLEGDLAARRTLLGSLRTANLRRCLVRMQSTKDFATCIDRCNDGWWGQLVRVP